MPFRRTNNPRKDVSGVNAYPHVDGHAVFLPVMTDDGIDKKNLHAGSASSIPHVLNEFDHFETHLDAIVCMQRICTGHARHAVVAITQDLDSHAFVHLEKRERNCLKSSSEEESAAESRSTDLTYICCIVKLPKEIVESLNQLVHRQGCCHLGELADVSK